MATMKGVVAFILFQCMLPTKAHVASLAATFNEASQWEDWKNVHGRSYSDENEERFRRDVWMQNLKKIEENRIFERDFVMGMNNLADLTEAEYRSLKLGEKIRGEKAVINGSTFLRTNNITLPKRVDWRTKGCVTEVKNEGAEATSWSLSAVGSLEGQYCIITRGKLVTLSEKKLCDCCSSCNLVDDAFRYMIAHNYNVDSKDNYDTNCNFSAAAYGASLTGYLDIPRGSEYELKFATAKIGPISVTIDASHVSFQFYISGIYDEPACSSTQLDLALLVVGYGSLNGKDYWLVKNNWGVSWGMNGYIMMARNKDNQCGIATLASYPTGVTLSEM